MSTTETLKYPPNRRCRKNICLLALVFGILFMSVGEVWGQCGVGTSTIYSVDFSAAKDTAWTLAASRSGTACVGTPGADDRCIRFNVTLNPGSDLLNFSADQLTGASFYSINCGPLIPIGTPACVVGLSSVCISFCKPGNNSVNYTVTASSLIRGSEDLVLRQNCSGTMSVTGISAASVNWRSIFPDASGAYNSYLSATTGVTTVTVTPTVGAPAYIDYEVSGTGTCTGLRRDTIRIYTVPPMTVNINPATPALCNGASVTLNATVSGGNPPYVYNWNTGATSTGITVSAIGNYSVNVADNTVGCPNEIGNVTVIAAATPAAPTVAGVSICSGSTATLTPSAPGGTYEWFDAASGGNSLGIGASYTTAVLTSNRTYYVQTTVNGCTSTRTAVTVTVNPIPAAPTAAGTTICAGQTASLLATAPGPSYEWYDAPSGGTLLASTAAFNTPVLNTSTTYYVQASNGSCSGARTAVTVTVTPLPAAPTIAGATICSGNTAILTATAPGGTYTWWDAPTNGTQIGSAIAFTTPVLNSNITYYVQTLVNGCVSATRTATTVTVNPTPAAPTVTSTPICGGNTATLNVTSVGDTYRWYNAANGGDLLQTGTSYTTPILNANATYYVSATSAAGCTGARTAATVTVTPIEDPSFVYAGGTFCVSGTNPIPTRVGGATGTFTSTPVGLVFADASTGEINVAASTPGLYTITFTTSGACVYSRSSDIRIINLNPDASFSYNSQFCVQQTNPFPVFVGTASAGIFSANLPGLVFKNTSTGEIDLALSSPGNYTITNTIAPAAGCTGDIETFNVVINPVATVNAGANLVVCEGVAIPLNGSVGGSATSGTWSIVSGTGIIANTTDLSSNFTPAIGQTSVSLMLTTDDPNGPCTAVTDIVVVDVRPTPALPSINPATICANTATTLVAFAPGGTYNWYATALGGTALVSPTATFNTGTLTTTTSFFATTTSADNCTSPRQEVIVTVNPLPVVNSAPTGSICSQVPQNYTPTATIPSSSFVWSRAAVPNITNAVITGQTTTSITEALESLSTSSIDVVYQIVPTANGCSGAPFDYTVTVKPIPVAPSASSAGAVCVGETISLSTPDRTGATYAWTGPDGFTSALRLPEIVNATVAKDGTYSIRVTVDGCLSPAGTVTQTVKTRPAAPTVSNSSPVCVGDNVTLSTPIVIGASYQWTGPNGYNTNLQNPTITNIASSNAGVYSLALSVNGCIGESSSTTVVVNPIPGSVAVNSTGPVCLSESLSITADAVPLAAYTWTGPNGFVSSVRDIVITNMDTDKTGVYQVIVSVAGCPSLANTINATLKPTPAAPTINPISPVCENGTLTLNASSDPTATYTWSGPAGFTSSIQNPVVSSFNASNAGTYVAYVVVDGCRSANNTVNVTMQSLPVVSTLGTNGPVCVGNTLQLNTATITGASYQWTGPNGFASTSQNPSIANVSLNNAGNYSLALSVNGCVGPASSVAATINPLPNAAVVTSTGPVCVTETLRMTANDIPTATYSWTGPNGFISTNREIDIVNMSAATAGAYQVIVSVAGCPSAPTSVNATLKPTPAAPTINPISPVCENGTLTLNASSDPTAIYTWTGPAGFSSTAQNPVIPTVATSNAGTYFANVVVNGCRSANNTVNVSVLSLPVVSSLSTNGPVCVGNTLQLNTATVAGASYQWTGPNGYTSTNQNPSINNVSLANAGNYFLALTVNGCVGPASSVAATINPLPNAAVVTSTGPVCVTETLRMTANDIPTATYSWTGPNGFASTNREIDIVNMSAATTGAYQVIVSVAGCPSAPTSVNATLKPTPAAPTINPISPVCENGTLTLNASSDPTAIYTWTGPAGFSSTAQNPVIPTINATNAGTYFANVVVNGCRSANNTVNVSVLSLPVVSSLSTNGPVCVGNTLQLNTATVAGASYQWTGPNGYTSTNQNPSINNVSLANAGNYSLALTVNGCVGPASLVAAVINPLPDAVGVSSSGPVCNAETLRISANEVPAGTYAWIGPNGFTSTSREIEIVNMNAAKTGSYQVVVSVAGCPSVANAINATLKPTPNAPTINPVSPLCENGTLILGTSLVSGASYSWSGPLGFISNTQSPVISSLTLANAGIYSANIVVDGCRSENSTVNVSVFPLPAAPTLSTNGAVCVGNVLQLNTPNVTGASYRWTGPAGFVSTLQNPAITNATITNAGKYFLSLTVNGCTGPSDSVVAIVNPLPGAVNINSSGPACIGRPLRFSADSVVAGVYTWSGPNGFTANTREVFFPTMNNTTAGTYQVTVAVAGCPGAANTITANLKPTPAAPVINAAAPICENGQLNLGMNTVAGALYQWTGPLSFTSTAQNPRIDSVQLNRSGIYSATVTVDGCISNNSAVNVVVIPEPPKPTITTNSPVCLGSSLQLSAIAAANASFRWVKTNTLFGVIQSPVIPSVSLSDSGRYGVSVMVNGCVSDTVFTNVVVDEPAFVTAGNDQVVCANNATINLAGLVTGGTNTGIWSTSGTGRFGSRISNLSTTYIPSSQDTAAGTVALTLTATNTGACPAVTSSVLVSITDAPTLDIGNNKVICPSDSIIPLNAIVRNAGGAIWTTTGTGRFELGNSLSTNYILSSQDQASNSFRLRATSTNNGNCLAVTDELVVNLSPAPIVDAGKDLLLYENTPFTLNPTVTGNIRSYEWTPANFLNASNIKNPVFRGNADQTLTLKVTSNNGCVTTDEVFISVAKPFPIPNVFSPNLDGVHDTWVIPELDKYPEAEVSVFDRTGKRVFYTVGYKTPWDGKYEGKYLPFATYYYIIIPRLIPGVFSGSVTILK